MTDVGSTSTIQRPRMPFRRPDVLHLSPIYAQLRSEIGPVAPVESFAGDPAWLVTGYEEARIVLRPALRLLRARRPAQRTVGVRLDPARPALRRRDVRHRGQAPAQVAHAVVHPQASEPAERLDPGAHRPVHRRHGRRARGQPRRAGRLPPLRRVATAGAGDRRAARDPRRRARSHDGVVGADGEHPRRSRRHGGVRRAHGLHDGARRREAQAPRSRRDLRPRRRGRRPEPLPDPQRGGVRRRAGVPGPRDHRRPHGLRHALPAQRTEVARLADRGPRGSHRRDGRGDQPPEREPQPRDAALGGRGLRVRRATDPHRRPDHHLRARLEPRPRGVERSRAVRPHARARAAPRLRDRPARVPGPEPRPRRAARRVPVGVPALPRDRSR